ncbi:type II secretion system major pseudopilin GspG [Sphingomicrobium lutaoense]|uniref:Type II secretion system core protein G n=1 Tax=Sphingomicrobium lutaoense TaxID=515949 RepID=A0A839Z2Q3_9SPHN|nr:type II secretion system major pseudopilin GspG [Sphingomicrobium lutaoense]MBB3764900.1 general secretion pathway protein G [Sphingomicrobium lutaoense]
MKRIFSPRRRPRQPRKNGFTLIELMVVIVIIGLLGTVVVINVLPSQDKALVTKAQTDIATLGQAMEMYRLDHFNYPDQGAGLAALVNPPGRSQGYIKRLPDDPWGNPYRYSVPGRNGPYDIYSLGADGAPGGEDNAADIYGE